MPTWAEKKALQAAAIRSAWDTMKGVARTPTSPTATEAAISDVDGYLQGLAQMYADHDGVGVSTYSGGTCPPKYAF